MIWHWTGLAVFSLTLLPALNADPRLADARPGIALTVTATAGAVAVAVCGWAATTPLRAAKAAR